MEKKWPLDLAEAWDNVGLLVGKRGEVVSRVMCVLDVTDAVIEQAVAAGAQMIVAHHSLLRSDGITKITDDTRLGRAVFRLAAAGIAVYAAHTNLDSGLDGTNDILARRLGLTNTMPLVLGEGEKPFACRMGQLQEPLILPKFAAKVARKLCLPAVNYVGSGMVSKVAVCSGGGAAVSYFTRAAAAGCDTYVTGDVKYHTAHEAAEMGLNLIDATHFGTEIIVKEAVRDYLMNELGVEVVVADERNVFETWVEINHR